MIKPGVKIKKAAAISLATLLAVPLAAPAYAATSTATTGVRFTDSVIDGNETGSITITKIIENNGHVVQSDGTEQNIEDGQMSVTSPDRAQGADGGQDTEDFDNSGSDRVHQNGESYTFSGSTNGTPNGNTELEGGQDAAGHTDAGRDNETYDGDEYSQGIVVPGIGFSYYKIADIVSVAGQVNRQKSDGNDETTETETTKDSATYSGVGTYYTNLDQNLIDLGDDFGIRPEVTEITDADGIISTAEDGIDSGDYFTSAALENYIAAIENIGINVAEINADETGASALTKLTQYDDAAADDHVHQSEDKAYGNFALTDDNGRASVDGLPLGLYLIGETDITRHDGLDADGNPIGRDEDTVDAEYPVLKNRAEPFLVSVPATNVSALTETDENGKTQTHEAGTVWVYDQYVYPKDSSINVSKAIVDPDEKDGATLRTREDYQIGDTVEQVIWADAPVPQPEYDTTADTDPDTDRTAHEARNYTRYRISDEMSKSLSFDGVTKVAIIDKIANATKDTDFTSKITEDNTLIPGTDYVVTKKVGKGEDDATAYTETEYQTRELHDFTVTLTESGLQKLNAITKDSQVVVFFDATLNKDAMIGPTDGSQNDTSNPDVETEANKNQPTLDFKDSAWPEQEVTGNKVYVFTHELDIRKDGLSDPTKAQFVVTRKNTADAAADNVTNPKNVTEGARTSDGSYLTSYGRDTVDTSTLAHENDYFRDNPEDATGHLAFVKEADGVYHLYDNSIDDVKNEYSAKKNAGTVGESSGTGNVGDVVTALHPGADGKIIVKGLDAEANTYTIKEIATENGHSLLRETFDINLEETDKQADAGSDAYDDEDVWKDGRLVSYTENGDRNVTDGSRVTSGNTTAALSINTYNNGIAELEVDNFKAVTLRTGGTGRYIIYLVAAAGVAALVVYAKKSKKEEDAA